MIVRTLRKVNRPWPDAERRVVAREAVGAARAGDDARAVGRHAVGIEDLRERPVLGSLPATIQSFAVDIVAAGVLLTAGLWVARPGTAGAGSPAARLRRRWPLG